MSTTKHTPGPWVVTGREGREIHVRAENESAYSMAVVDIDPKPGRQIANARLMAASPELLEALTALVEHAKIRPAFALPGVKGVREGGKFLAAMEAAESAIAKAAGGES